MPNDCVAPLALDQSNSKHMKIAFYGHFGSLNSGNESTLLAILARLRSIYPDCDFCCICSNPESVVASHGIEAIPISRRVARIWDRQARFGSRLRMVFIGISEELKDYVRAFRTLKGTDMLIIPGTGLLTDAYGLSPWGPLSMFRWSVIAKLRGCRLLFISVGAGPIDRTLGRFLVKSALSLADYRSYRDDSSMNYLKDIGFRTGRDRIYPDLVFSLPEGLLPINEREVGRRPVVGLGLMVYAGKYSVANPIRETYTAYLESLVAFVEWLLTHDHDVRLLLGDGDTFVIQEFKSLLRTRVGPYDNERVVDQPITSVEQILSQLAATDLVVATRFHNVLLALLLNRPVIAISFHHKCASLMSQMGVSEYCHDINRMNAHGLIEQFQELKSNSEMVRGIIKQKVDESRGALDEQYNLLFKGP
jgi:polysaccharide pyruvyl transferase WcaK-like protein